jgi:hypothetical protein
MFLGILLSIGLFVESSFQNLITSPLENPDASPVDLDSSYGKSEELETSPNEERGLEKRYSCPDGSGRGRGQFEYDYGCDKGWCWRNCDVNVGSLGGGVEEAVVLAGIRRWTRRLDALRTLAGLRVVLQ